MDPTQPVADPERALTIAYAPADARIALSVLWRLDERLAGIVRATREPQLGTIRLAWWRDALERLDSGSVPQEPILVAAAAELLPRGASGSALGDVADGWAALLGELDTDAMARHAADRGGRLFSVAGILLRQSPPQLMAAGEGWALVDLACHLGDAAAADRALALARERFDQVAGWRWPGRLRSLGALAVLAAGDAAGDVAARRPGSPARVARALVHRLTGR